MTGLLEGLTSVEGGPLGVLTELVDGLTLVPDEALAPVISTLNDLIAGLSNGTGTGAIGGLVGGLLGGLVPGAGSGGEAGGLITSMQDVLDNLLDGTQAAPAGDLIDALINPDDGVLSTVTGLLEDLTDTSGSPLGVLTELVDGLTQIPGQALEPVIGTLNDLIAGITNGLGAGGLGELVGGLLGGGLLGGSLLGARAAEAGLLDNLLASNAAARTSFAHDNEGLLGSLLAGDDSLLGSAADDDGLLAGDHGLLDDSNGLLGSVQGQGAAIQHGTGEAVIADLQPIAQAISSQSDFASDGSQSVLTLPQQLQNAHLI